MHTVRRDSRSVRSYYYPCLALLIFLAIPAIGGIVNRNQPRSLSLDSLGALTVREVLGGELGGPKIHEARRDRAARHRVGTPIGGDAYATWLAARLIHDSAAGTLFCSNGNKIAICLSDFLGDMVYWYIAGIAVAKPDGSDSVAGGPWLVWADYGSDKTAPPGVDPWITEYVLNDVSIGDVVTLSFYRLPRPPMGRSPKPVPSEVISNGTAELFLRIPVPVVTSLNVSDEE